jgi:hypothetical protein
MLTMILAAYFIAGLLFCFVGPPAKGLRLAFKDASDSPNATPLRLVALTVALGSGIVIAWPILVPSARRSLQPPTLLDATFHVLNEGLKDAERRRRTRAIGVPKGQITITMPVVLKHG